MSDQTPHWYFKKHQNGDTERNPVGSEFFTNNTRLESIVREGIQNSLDAKDPANKGPVRVSLYYSGGTDDHSLHHSMYKRYCDEESKARYASKNNGLEKPLPLDKDCPFFLIEDFGTVGLTGPIDRDPQGNDASNYYNFFFRENGTDKAGSGSLGSWGAGKIVFQRASRLKTVFVYSVRKSGCPKKILAGKATLQIHRDANGVKWEPDGWFGIRKDVDVTKFMPKQPIVEEDFIKRFIDDFNLSRRNDEPGLSVVIPYVRATLNEDEEESDENQFRLENIAQAVIRNFLVAIINRELVVDVKARDMDVPFRIDHTTLQAAAKKYLPDQEPEKITAITGSHSELALSALSRDFPNSQRFRLRNPRSSNSHPTWSEERFDKSDLESMKKLLDAGQSVLIDVPMWVCRKGKSSEPIEGLFQVALTHAPNGEGSVPAFYRQGLLIDNIALRKAGSSYLSLVIVGKGSVAEMLVTAEPPAHNDWRIESERLQSSYKYPVDHVNFIKQSVRFLIEKIERVDDKPSWGPLQDIFCIKREPEQEPESEADSDVNQQSKPVPGPIPREDGNLQKEDELDLFGNERTSPFLIRRVQKWSQWGFEIGSNPDFCNDRLFPMTFRFVMGYRNLRDKMDYSPFDFDLGKDDPVMVKIVGGKDVVEVEKKDNYLTLHLRTKGKFSVAVIGFDANRDLMIATPIQLDVENEED